MLIRQERVYLCLGLLICILFSIGGARMTWPPLDGDAPAYFSPAVEFSLGRGLTNPTWLPPLNDSIDGPNGRRYIYHGFVYPLLIGWLGELAGAVPRRAWPRCIVLT